MKSKLLAPLEEAIDEAGGHHLIEPMVVKSRHHLMLLKIFKSLTGLTAVLLFLFVTSCAPKHAVKQEEQIITPPAAETKLPDAVQQKVITEEKKTGT